MSVLSSPGARRIDMGLVVYGSGLLATGLRPALERMNIVLFAAGVSNSRCDAPSEFARERKRLDEALDRRSASARFIYVSTTSVTDPSSQDTPYVQQKRAIERQLRTTHNHVIVRLPQVAGHSPNPHTLLNFLYSRIARSEHFELWEHAERNIIDVRDACAMLAAALRDPQCNDVTITLANTHPVRMRTLVACFEAVVGKPAVFTAVARGAACNVPTVDAARLAELTGVKFDEDYVHRVVAHYYARPR